MQSGRGYFVVVQLHWCKLPCSEWQHIGRSVFSSFCTFCTGCCSKLQSGKAVVSSLPGSIKGSATWLSVPTGQIELFFSDNVCHIHHAEVCTDKTKVLGQGAQSNLNHPNFDNSNTSINQAPRLTEQELTTWCAVYHGCSCSYWRFCTTRYAIEHPTTIFPSSTSTSWTIWCWRPRGAIYCNQTVGQPPQQGWS